MEEQIKKLQEELMMVRIERDSLILEKKKTFIKTRLNNQILSYCYRDVKSELLDGNYLKALNYAYNFKIMQALIDDYGYDLVVECMIELFVPEEEENE